MNLGGIGGDETGGKEERENFDLVYMKKKIKNVEKEIVHETISLHNCCIRLYELQ